VVHDSVRLGPKVTPEPCAESAQGSVCADGVSLLDLDVALDPLVLVDLIPVDVESAGKLNEASCALPQSAVDSVLRARFGRVHTQQLRLGRTDADIVAMPQEVDVTLIGHRAILAQGKPSSLSEFVSCAERAVATSSCEVKDRCRVGDRAHADRLERARVERSRRRSCTNALHRRIHSLRWWTVDSRSSVPGLQAGPARRIPW